MNKRNTILIIEDSPQHAQQIKEKFPLTDFEIVTISNFGNSGEQKKLLKNALQQYSDSLVLIICDIDNGQGDNHAGEVSIRIIREYFSETGSYQWMEKTIPIIIFSKVLSENGTAHSCVQILKSLDAKDVSKIDQTCLSLLEDTATYLINLFTTLRKAKVQQCNGKLFISHSSKDKKYADAFSKFVQKCFGYEQSEIFYSSQGGTGVPFGKEILKYIKKELLLAEEVFLMVSKNYKESEICMSELGGTWITRSDLYFTLLPDTDYKELGWGFDKFQAINIGNDDDLNRLREHYKKEHPNRKLIPDKEWGNEKKMYFKKIKEIHNEKIG